MVFKNMLSDFVLNLNNARDKKMTGPYHSIQSLEMILKNFKYFKKSVEINKKLTLKKLIDEYEISQKKKDFYGVHNYDVNLVKSQGYGINDIIPKNKEIFLTKNLNENLDKLNGEFTRQTQFVSHIFSELFSIFCIGYSF